MFTRREKHVLIIIVLTFAVLFWAFSKSLITQETIDSWELAGWSSTCSLWAFISWSARSATARLDKELSQTLLLEITMIDPEARLLREMKIENMRAEQEYLRVLRNTHLQWMNGADDLEINSMHGDIVDLINQLEARFEIVLETLQAQIDKE
jgi:hypothetical protein